MKDLWNYRAGKLDAYQDALIAINVIMDAYETEDAQNALKRVQERLKPLIDWSKKELERLEKQQ